MSGFCLLKLLICFYQGIRMCLGCFRRPAKFENQKRNIVKLIFRRKTEKGVVTLQDLRS